MNIYIYFILLTFLLASKFENEKKNESGLRRDHFILIYKLCLPYYYACEYRLDYLDFYALIDFSNTIENIYTLSLLHFIHPGSLIQYTERLFHWDTRLHRCYCESHLTIFRTYIVSLKHHFLSCIRVNLHWG